MPTAFSLDDVMSSPQDPDLLKQHLLSIGAVPLPAPTPNPAIAPMAPPKAPEPEVKDFKAPTHFSSGMEGPGTVTLSPGGHPSAVAPMEPLDAAAPDVGSVSSPTPEADSISAGVKPMTAPSLDFHQRQALPTLSPGVKANSPEFFQNQIERIEDQRQNPYGSDENHPGFGGKLAHILGRVGNVAGDIFAPNAMQIIPGTDLNRNLREQTAEKNEAGAEERQTNKQLAEEKTRHEMTLEDQANTKIDQLQEKIDETNRHNMSTEDAALRKQGLMRDPNNPGKNVPVPEDQLSDDEKAVLHLKQSKANQAEAAALVNRLKADPNSPQNEAIRTRLKIMAQNAGTAAERVGLSKAEYLRDTLGLDADGNPLPGISYDDKTGRPIGTKVAAGTSKGLAEFNKNFEKPAEDKEAAFKQMDKAYNEYQEARARGEELPTGAQSMVALSNHMSTTFGNVRGARITKDMIHEHLGARGVSDMALVAVQRLTNGDQLSPAQWRAFHDLVSDARKNAWQTAGKEAVRAKLPIDFLPEELANDTGFTASFQTPVVTRPGEAPTRKTGEGPAAAAPREFGAAPAGTPENKTGTLPDGTKVIVKGGKLVENK